MNFRIFGRTISMGTIVLLGQSSCAEWRDCSDVDLSRIEELPLLLSETGLYENTQSKELSLEAVEYSPRFPLWTDGAKKDRWLLLPVGTRMNTENEEEWIAPVGTKFFKSFSRDGVLIETRLNQKTEDGWIAATYLWNEEGEDAERQLEAIPNASGTNHDIPSAAECSACHGGRSDFTLGFSAVQLSIEDRNELYNEGILSHASTSDITLSESQAAGLGVLHGNCSHCHNPNRSEHPQSTTCYDPTVKEEFNLSLPVSLTQIEDAPALISARHELLRGGIIERMSHRNSLKHMVYMPPLGTEEVDEEGLAAVQKLIDELQASGL